MTASFEMEIIGDKLVISVLDGEYLRVHERNLTGGNWTNSFQRWMLQDSNNVNNTLVMRDGYILYDSNNNDQGIASNSEGTWAVHSIDVPDSENKPDFLVISDGSEERWHITHTESSLAQNHLVWTTGMLSQSGITTSTSFTSISTEHTVPMESHNGNLMLAYSQSSTNNFLSMRIVSDLDRDLVPDTHDDLPMIGNQWEDSDSDGFGDNSEGPQADMCPSTLGHSKFDRHGCDDYDQDGWSMQTTIVSMTMVSLGGDNLVVMTMTKTDGSMMEYWVIDIQQIGNKLWIPTVIHMVITTAQTAVM